jgi:hypothetical protein
VYNTTNSPAQYDIVANSSTAPLWNYIDLADSTPTNFTVSSFDTLTNFYRFVVPGTNAGVLFEIYGLDGDADLLIKRADLPAPDLYDFSYLQRIDLTTFNWLDELTAVRTNIFIPDINATNWLLQIVSPYPNGGTVNGTVCAKVTDTNGILFDCRPFFIINPCTNVTGICLLCFTNSPGFIVCLPNLAWTSVPGENYAVEQTANLRSWTTATNITATGTRTTFSPSPSTTDPARFYRIKQVPR